MASRLDPTCGVGKAWHQADWIRDSAAAPSGAIADGGNGDMLLTFDLAEHLPLGCSGSAERYRNLSRLPQPVPVMRKDDEHRLIMEALVERGCDPGNTASSPALRAHSCASALKPAF